MLQCLGMLGYVVTGNTYLDIWICCYRSMLQCIGMCVYMLLQVYVTVSRYVFGYVVSGLCYSV